VRRRAADCPSLSKARGKGEARKSARGFPRGRGYLSGPPPSPRWIQGLDDGNLIGRQSKAVSLALPIVQYSLLALALSATLPHQKDRWRT
jgi:hypothetical protein